jgi:hypothetical protein
MNAAQTVKETLMVSAAFCLITGSAFSQSMCFDRHYDADHLANHPDQLVTSMTLKLDPDGSGNMPFNFKIAMTKRGDKNVYGSRRGVGWN